MTEMGLTRRGKAKGSSARRKPKPRTKSSHARRADLMRSAADLFVAKGVAATTIDDIVADAAVAKGTFYLYFKSKDEILGALREAFIAGFVERVEASAAACAPDDWSGRLRAWIEAAVHAYLDRVALHDVVFHDYRPDHRGMKSDNAAVAHLARLLGAGDAAGAWRADNLPLTATFLFNGFHAAVDEAIASQNENRAALVDAIVRLCAGAISLNLR